MADTVAPNQPTKDTTKAQDAKAADARAADAKAADAKAADDKAKQDEPTYAKTDPRAHADLEPGESRLVASGAPVPDGPEAPTWEEQAERREAGIPEPPIPGPGTDMYLTAAGYVVVPAGVNPDDPVVVVDPRMSPPSK